MYDIIMYTTDRYHGLFSERVPSNIIPVHILPFAIKGELLSITDSNMRCCMLVLMHLGMCQKCLNKSNLDTSLYFGFNF